MLLLKLFFGALLMSGGFSLSKNYIVYLPKSIRDAEGGLSGNESYCFHYTWLGMNYGNDTFYRVANKTCKDFFTAKENPLCVDPMAVTFEGGVPNNTYILENYPMIATCKLSKDQVCVKYTEYYNGIASHVVRYCTRVDIESEGPMRSGCLKEIKGVRSYEVCACVSDSGAGGICNSSTAPSAAPLAAAFLAVCALSRVFR